MLIEVRNLQDDPLPGEVLDRAARAAAGLAAQDLDALSLVFVDEARIARLNQQYLGHPGPTDVIAFPAEAGDGGRCGEVIVCVPVAREQAAALGHGLERELAVLVAHGILHCLGFTDGTDETKAHMVSLQEAAADTALAG